jgi:hypothetical protein
MQMMATCNRFERLIGQTHQFYKNFKFCYDQKDLQKTEETQYLKQIRRRFGIVEIFGGSVRNKESFLRRPILGFLKKHGGDILKIKFDSLTLNESDFLEVMKFVTEVEELEMSEVESTESDPDENFKMKHLTKLVISESTNLGFCARFVPSSLKILKLIYIFEDEHWALALLEKQKHLEELSLICCEIQDFKFDPENCRVEKLTIDFLKLLNKSAFQKFSEFIKIQQSVTELTFSMSQDEWTNHNYAVILTHLLSLKSLKKLSFGCAYYELTLEVFSRLKVCNPAVKTLIIMDPPHERADLTSLPKFFPNVTDLKITRLDDDVYMEPVHPYFLNLQPVNSMKIRKLDIYYMSEEMLAQLELKEMREFRMSEIVSTDGEEEDEFSLENWTTFINNNCQLEVLHLLECKMSVEQLQVTLENLPLLKSLEFTVFGFAAFSENPEYSADEYKKEQAEKAAQLIGEKYDRFEHLKLNISCVNIRACILKYLEEHYPGVKLNK